VAVVNKQAQIKEILKCGKDPLYFINKYARIQHPKRGLIPFDTFEYQNDCVNDYLEHRFNVVLKARQLGLSTITAAYAAWLILFHRDKQVLTLATKKPTAINFTKKVKIIIKHLPKWMVLAQTVINNQQHVEFDSGSWIKAIPTSEDAGRSEGLTLLIIDEAAWIRNFDDLWTGLYSTLSSGGRCIILSTPNGVGNEYHRIYTDAESGVNDFNPIRLPWHVHPERDEEWFEKECRQLGSKRKIAQELLCVTAETKIITPCGYKEAHDLCVGDKVLTHKGRFKKIIGTTSRILDLKKENIYDVSTPGNRQAMTRVTGNHPLLVSRFNKNKRFNAGFWDQFKQEYDVIGNEFVQTNTLATETCHIVGHVSPLFKDENITNELQQIDFAELASCVKTKKITVTDNTVKYYNQRGNGTKRFIKVDYNLGRFIGLFIAEGMIPKLDSGYIRLAFHTDERDTLVKFCCDYLESLNVLVRHGSREGTNCYIVESHNKLIRALMNYFISGKKSHKKHWNMDRVLSTNKEFIKGILVGHFQGDGTHDDKITNKLRLTSVSARLIMQNRTLLTMFGHFPRVIYGAGSPCGLEIDNVNGKPLELIINNTKEAIAKPGTRLRLIDDFVVCRKPLLQRVNNELSTFYDHIPVFNFDVEDDHTYVTESIVVHNCDFVASGETFLTQDDLDHLMGMIKDPVERAGFDRNIWIWAHPMPEHKYVMSADVARGDSKDFSAFHIIDTTAAEIVAEYKGKIPPDNFGEILNEYGLKYNNALLAPENNTFGWATITKLQGLNYPKLYSENSKAIYIVDYVPQYNDKLPGFNTNSKTRIQILTKLEEIIRNKQLKIYSSRFFNELKTFVWKGQKPQAQKNHNDDLVMSLAIGTWLYDASAEYSKDADTLNKNMLGGMSVETNNSEEILPQQQSNFVNPFAPPTNPFGNQKQPQPLVQRSDELYKWLI